VVKTDSGIDAKRDRKAQNQLFGTPQWLGRYGATGA
jgi:hypothetical protein